MREKRGAIELSVGTIVIVVLAMSMLILGLVLIRTIFKGATNVADLSSEQIISEVNKLFGEDKKVVIYPAIDTIVVKSGETRGFGIVIRNQLSGAQAKLTNFSYEVVPVSDVEKDCGVTKEEVYNLFASGSEKDMNIPVATGDPKAIKVLFETGEGDPICTIRFRVDVKANGENYDYDYVFVKFTG